MEKKVEQDSLFEELFQLHKDLICFATQVQRESARLLVEHNCEGQLLYEVGSKLTAYVVNLHEASLTLCESGWTHITPLLLRTMMECQANYLAIIKNREPEYMAYKFICNGYFKTLITLPLSEDQKKKTKSAIGHYISLIRKEEEQQKAYDLFIGIMQKGTTTAYWFQPEEESPSKIIDRYVGKKFLYRALSMVVHSTHFGMTWFKDEPDDIDFNPSENPKFTNNALLMSNQLLLDSLWLRSRAEGLNLRPLYEGLLSKSKRAARSLLKGPLEYVN